MNIIFSLDQPNKPTNQNIYEHLLQKFNGIQCQGCYKGTTETSILIPNASYATYLFIQRIAQLYNQESILVIINNMAYLHYCNQWHIKQLGKWTKVDTINGHDAYTIINNKIYVTK